MPRDNSGAFLLNSCNKINQEEGLNKGARLEKLNKLNVILGAFEIM